MPITVLLVDDHPMFRKGLRLLMEGEPDISVVGEAGDGEEAVEQVRELSPNVVVMDITMPNLNGIEATHQILNHSPDTKVVALSIHAGKRFVKDMLGAGAKGYILKDSIPEEMIKGIRKVMRDEVYLSSAITSVVLEGFLEDELEEQPSETPTVPTLRTKFQRPLISENIIPRPRLFELLEKRHQGLITLISAPAGYGKTMLVSYWLETSSSPSAWVNLDDPTRAILPSHA